ncbi:cobalamin biosynthesis protein [Phaeobacter sp. HF9A]|uniref:cobalamin biosynthesis protein n=1 Tax=Phaeobacter sp. HF9A TaxID=2721561 RepID=UPI001430CD0E|nr:cobalamin biosynthesis protein [Phaeobacter sp. HF9A]NIZ15623.1 cobalamin biosynthesis protein [Phaeobacter sp. HF9A]
MMIAGLGFSARATTTSLMQLLAALPQRPQALAALRAKAETALFQDCAASLGLPVFLLDESEIAGIETPTHSPRILARFNTGSLAEAVALVAARKAGAEALLIQTRLTAADGLATVALAETKEI